MLKLSLAITCVVEQLFEQTLITYPRTICVQYLRILFSSFAEKIFKSLH